MKKRRQTLYIMLLVVVLVTTVFAVSAIADAGNFSGGSDYGGSGSYSGGSYDYGSSSGAWGYSSDGEGGSLGTGGWVFALILVLIVFAVTKKKSNRRGGGNTAPARGASATNYAQLAPIQTLRDADPNFSEAAIKEKISNLYVQMQNAWQAKDFEQMRPHMTDALYNQFMLQLNELKKSGCTNYIERIAVLDVNLAGWRSDETNDAIVAMVYTRIIDYTMNDKTGKMVSGSRSAEKFMTYEWTLIRSKGMKTPAPSGEGSEGTVTINCPNCGAPVEINQSAKCPYCGSVIQAADYDWVISEIKGIAQRTGR